MGRRSGPWATYRLQFNRDFTFSQALEIIPYLQALGISHVYASPCLKARSGSAHGYDIVDHNALNPEIGDREDFETFVATLHRYGMGLILDIVPNHMGVGGSDNVWWLDVLEKGEASPYAGFFDIDWCPVKEELRAKVLVPLLGDHYGRVLENGELKLAFDPERGEFNVYYYEHQLPIAPETYPLILTYKIERLTQHASASSVLISDWWKLIADFEQLRKLRDAPAEHGQTSISCKQRLAHLARSRLVESHIAHLVSLFNGIPGQAKSFDLLHQLLERQSFRSAFWRVASDEINYRRFFDINDLACLRQENPEVFEATHRFVLELVNSGQVDGLRIDHPDGLSDPIGYCRCLKEKLAEADGGETQADGAGGYLIVEKILAAYEPLHEDWQVQGTTGYEFATLVNGLFVYAGSERALTRRYARFIRYRPDFDELLYRCKRLIIRSQLSSGLTVLSNMLNGIAQSDRYTRDYTLNGLREALIEVVACFPVYRTYVRENSVTEEDRRFVKWAIAQAKKRSPAADVSIFDFIHDLLLLEKLEGKSLDYRANVLHFAMKMQQYTAPVMAKALEDTAFYIYNRLASLNEVGGDPRRFSVTPAAFHHANQERRQRWPYSMLSTSTHDSKRSEDVRARIDVLSELPHEWGEQLARWSRLNRSKKRLANDLPAPSRNDEYLLYQTLLGAWPLEMGDEEDLAAFRERIEAYMLKAAKEAKVNTSWINPNEEYEQGLTLFIRGLLGRLHNNRFLADFLPFQRRVMHFGLLNSLSQTLLKLTAPGVSDIYQGNEIGRFNLVDPDNRGPVDYAHRQALLSKLMMIAEERGALDGFLADLQAALEDGRAKLYVTWKGLAMRRRYPDLFTQGEYLPLAPQGEGADHICAFARRHQNATAVIVAPRWFARLLNGRQDLPIGFDVWRETWLEAPQGERAERFVNVLTGEQAEITERDGKAFFSAADLLARFPVALLVAEG